MLRSSLAALLAAGVGLATDPAPPPRPVTPAEQLKRLVKESEEIDATFMKELRADRTDEGAIRANEKHRRALGDWSEKALRLVRAHPESPETFGVIAAYLDWSSVNLPELLGVLRKHHFANPDLGRLFMGLVQDRKDGPAFVEEVADEHPLPAVRGEAALALGWFAKWRLMQDGEERFGFRGTLPEADRKRWEARGEKYLTLAAEKYPDGEARGRGAGKVGPAARAELVGLKNLSRLRVGREAPELAGEDLDGKPLKLSDHRGKVTVVVFWASWCGPCMKDVPHEKKLAERLKERPFTLVGVNGDDDPADGKAAAEKAGMPWRSLKGCADGPGGPLTRAWNVHSWPTVYVLDAAGVIRFVDTRGEDLDRAVDGLLKEMEKD
ncbi:MAG: TlpA family protein disulfide reductase [Gemmataceae bacterium]|nr:TlpA family protein disulfide reductase [Gemmataceae bacterium]